MTVTELRQALEQLEQQGKGELDVKFAYNYGDYWNTTVASGVFDLEEAKVEYSDYHQMDKVVEYDAEEDQSELRTVVLLS